MNAFVLRENRRHQKGAHFTPEKQNAGAAFMQSVVCDIKAVILSLKFSPCGAQCRASGFDVLIAPHGSRTKGKSRSHECDAEKLHGSA
ncbi:hypothetical protein [Hyphococcus sp.]|jgi:hypothetical protein|uniref:hypothetical protein n=1 Tax=Hyphococcus sp. TaxID=2038636 RepID=UPI003D101416